MGESHHRQTHEPKPNSGHSANILLTAGHGISQNRIGASQTNSPGKLSYGRQPRLEGISGGVPGAPGGIANWIMRVPALVRGRLPITPSQWSVSPFRIVGTLEHANETG